MTHHRHPDGIDLAAGIWTVDPGHAEVGFVGRHFGLTKIRGRFTAVDGTVVVGDDLPARPSRWHRHGVGELRRHRPATTTCGRPTSSTSSTTRRRRSGRPRSPSTARTASITGELTIKGVTRPVTLDVDYLGQAIDPWGGERAVFSATASVNREHWGLTWNMVLDAGGLLVSKEIRLEIEVELVRQTA